MIKLSEEFIVDSWSIPINLIKIRLKTKLYGDTLKSNKIHSGHVTKNQGWTQVLSTGKQFLLHLWRPSCYSRYKSGDKSWMKKEPNTNILKIYTTNSIC